MTTTSHPTLRRDRIGTAVSIALALLATEAALAQQVAAPAAAASAATNSQPAAKPAEAKDKAPVNELESVLIIGTRKSQQSAIDRKKRAATAQDSIVAEDVGSFPDRNIGEAIARVAGVALERGDFGEGTSISIRGNGPELTRVEMDGMSVRSGAGTDLLGGGDGRGTEFRELSSDLIKSVDVVKGSTAAMTEGSLGGGVIITTRTGLDFDKPFYSLKLEGSQSSLNKKVTPNFNLVLSNKFLDGKLGVIANLNHSRWMNEQHGISQGGSNSTEGLSRSADFDNSAEKTYTLNPSTLSGSNINNPMLSSALASGTGTFNSASQVELLTKSAAAQTKADCLTAFPDLTTAQVASIASSARTAAYTQRQNEQLTCLNQWNDYTPSKTVGFRYNYKSQDDKRDSGDIRFDFKVNDKLTVYTKLAASKRKVFDTVGFLGVGSTPTFNATSSFTDNTTTNTRSLATGVSGSLLPNSYSWRASNVPLVNGTTTNILPGYTVDASHHVTSYTTDNGSLTTDTIFSTIDTNNKTITAGGEYRDGRLNVSFMGGITKSTAMRYDRRASFSYNYGRATYSLQDNGLWSFALPDGTNNIDQFNYTAYSLLNAPAATALIAPSATVLTQVDAVTAANAARYTNPLTLQVIRSFDKENYERSAKFDVSYNMVDKVPFLTSLKGGMIFRDSGDKTWTGAGGLFKDPVGTYNATNVANGTYQYGVYMPNVNSRWYVVGCEDTTASKGTNGGCDYGYVKKRYYNQKNSNDLTTGAIVGSAASYAGVQTLTQSQFQQLIQQTLTLAPAGQFYGGAKDRSDTLINGWNQIDIDKLFQLAGIPVRLDCFRQCTASDGKVWDMPFSSAREKATAAYAMEDFEIPLWGRMELAGNVGVRMVKTDVQGSGFMTFKSVRKNADWQDTDALRGSVTSYSVSQNTAIKGSATDVMPSLNLMLWPIEDKLVMRYSIARTVARPGITKLLPNGNTCTISQITEETDPDDEGNAPDQGCSGTMGNPDLKPQTNLNQNLSWEWYPNKDNVLSLGIFRQRGIIGAPTIATTRYNNKVFKNSTTVDPQTGVALKDYEFTFAQWDNAPASTRRGIEFGLKSAFTFLPSVLRYTGVDANYSRLRSTQGAPTRDLISGDVLPIIGEPKYSWNASLWYDDGGFQARVSMQVVAQMYSFFSPNTTTNLGVNNYDSVGTTGWRLAYNPGAPYFKNKTAYVDAKMSYRFKNGVEIFATGNNLTGERVQTSTGGYQEYSDGIPSISADGYSGRRYSVGVTLRSPR